MSAACRMYVLLPWGGAFEAWHFNPLRDTIPLRASLPPEQAPRKKSHPMTTLTQGRPAGSVSQSSPAMAHDPLAPSDTFSRRHIGPGDADIAAMLATLGYKSLDALTDTVVPASIRLNRALNLPGTSLEGGKPRGELRIPVAMRDDRAGVEALARELPRVKAMLDGAAVRKVIYVPGRVVNLVVS